MTLFAHGGISIFFFVGYADMINETMSQRFHPYFILTRQGKVRLNFSSIVCLWKIAKFHLCAMALLNFLLLENSRNKSEFSSLDACKD